MVKESYMGFIIFDQKKKVLLTRYSQLDQFLNSIFIDKSLEIIRLFFLLILHYQ